MNVVAEWFAGLATLSGFLYFLTGFAVSYLFHYTKARLKHRKIQVPWHLAGIAIGVVAILITSFQAQVAYTTAVDTSKESRECQIQFNTALRERAKITTENDALSAEQRTIVFNWIHDLLFPPPPFNAMDTQDPQRQQYALARTLQTEQIFQKSINDQNALMAERAKHTYPDPTCGN
jgi:hypothetical protein